jgi:hypothetical protein
MFVSTLVNRGGQTDERTMRPRLRDSLLLKHVLFLTLTLILVAGAIGQSAYLLAQRMLLKDVHERLALIAAARVRLLETSTAEELREVALVVNRTQLGQLLAARAQGSIDEAYLRKEVERILAESQRGASGFRKLWVADLQGKVVAATKPAMVGQSIVDHPLFAEGLPTRSRASRSLNQGNTTR